MMITIPGVSLRHGASVWSTANGAAKAAPLSRDPLGLARSFAAAGFSRIHVVDLDGLCDRSESARAIEAVIRDGAIGVQVMVNDQSNDLVDRMLEAGAESVVVRAVEVDDLLWIESIAQSYPGEIVLATDVHDRRSASRSWTRAMPIDPLDLVDDIAGMPLAGLLVTLSDGSEHPTAADLFLLEDVAQACAFPLLAATEASVMRDLRALENRGVAGVILGVGLYSGALDMRALTQEFNS